MPAFGLRLGKLYVAVLFKSDSQPKPDETKKDQRNFQESGRNTPATTLLILKDVAGLLCGFSTIERSNFRFICTF